MKKAILHPGRATGPRVARLWAAALKFKFGVEDLFSFGLAMWVEVDFQSSGVKTSGI